MSETESGARQTRAAGDVGTMETTRAYEVLVDDLAMPDFDTFGSDAASWLRSSWLRVGNPEGLRDGEPVAIVRERLVLAALHVLALQFESILAGNGDEDVDLTSANEFLQGLPDAVILVLYGLECGLGPALDEYDIDSPESVASSASTELILIRVETLRRALIAEEGPSRVFVRLVAAIHASAHDVDAEEGATDVRGDGALRDDSLDEILNDVTADKARAFEWLCSG